MRPGALIFDFDGVLLESESAGNRHIAQYLTARGYPTSEADSFARFMGLSGQSFIDAVERWIGGPLPDDFMVEREAENRRVMAEGIAPVGGAVAFVERLPDDLPRAIASSSSTEWIAAHCAHLGIRSAFGDHLYSGKEHVARGKPAPDLYLHAADALGVPIARCTIIEDSPVGARGAVASGARVIGLCAGKHCAAGHDARLRDLGVHAVAHDFDEVARLLALDSRDHGIARG